MKPAASVIERPNLTLAVHGTRPVTAPNEPLSLSGPAPGRRVAARSGTSPAPGASGADVIRLALLTLSAVALGLVFNLVVVSGLEHHAAQTQAFNQFRTELAEGTAPIGPLGSDHKPLPPGTPMALLQIPSLGVKEVVGEGTTGPVLMSGPGHLRSTVFPGGVGSSVIFGRAATYGAPFAHIKDLQRGAQIKVTTAVGTSTFRVVDTRYAGDVVPPLASGQARLTLATATTSFFVPSGVVWVDADLVGSPLPAASPGAAAPASERPLGVDTDTGVLGALALWLAILVGALAAAIWMWNRRGHIQAWIIFSAPVAVVAYFVASHASAMLPNLM
jgi:sortase A